jgi:hypothetical protein
VAELEEPDAATSVKSWPVPLRLTVTVTPWVLSVTVKVPVRGPPVRGVKLTLKVQSPPTTRLLPQLLVWLKLLLTATLLMLSVAQPGLVSVTAWVALVVFTNWLPKVRLPGETAGIGVPAVPVPTKGML